MSVKRLPLGALVAVLVTTSGLAAADEKDRCIEASDRGQLLRDQGKLRAAREALLVCARDACPSVLRRECASWLAGVDARIPSIVVRARDASGHDLVDVRVTLDGQSLGDRLDGRSVVVDPGEHHLHAEATGFAPTELTVLSREGERARVVDVVMKPASDASEKAAPTPTSARSSDAASAPVPVATYVLGGLGVVGLSAFTYFGLHAKSEVSDMRSTCAPSCEQSRVDTAKREQLIANVSLGVGVLALAGATYFWLTASPEGPSVGAHAMPGGVGLVARMPLR